jgi:hypothetical protein
MLRRGNSANRAQVELVDHDPMEETMATKSKSKRTTHRSGSGKKLYAVRDQQGQFKDIQTYQRAQGQDVRRRSKSERAKKK